MDIARLGRTLVAAEQLAHRVDTYTHPLLCCDEEWHEGDHPRDEGGQFTGGGGARYTPKFGTSKKANVAEAIKAIASHGHAVGEYHKPGGHVAIYSNTDGKIYINSAAKFWKDPAANMKLYAGFNSSDHPEHVIHHEMGHAMYDAPDNFFALHHQDRARKEVSKYAARNPKEFVSEVHAALQAGREFSPEVMQMFKQYARPRQAR